MLTAVSAHKSLVSMYHANLSGETKAFIYNQFNSIQSDLRCLVCTIAFGMVRRTKRTCTIPDKPHNYTCTCDWLFTS